MTRQHFEALAQALRVDFPNLDLDGKVAEAQQETWYRAIRTVAEVCSRYNPNFDRERFYSAAGLERE